MLLKLLSKFIGRKLVNSGNIDKQKLIAWQISDIKRKSYNATLVGGLAARNIYRKLTK